MAVRVHVLHHPVVRPLVGQVEGPPPGTAVGVAAGLVVEELVVEIDVDGVDGVIERHQNDLRRLCDTQAAYVCCCFCVYCVTCLELSLPNRIAGWVLTWNVLATAVAVGQQAHILATLGRRLVGGGLRVDRVRSGGRIAVDVHELLGL